jgi:hypothetical protein
MPGPLGEDASGEPAPARGESGRADRVVSVPLILLFFPDSDPTEAYPGESADVEGYFVAPNHTVTVAATATSPRGVEMLDAVWATLRRKGVARRHMLLLDDRGRTVSVMTLRTDASEETLRLLRSLLVVPVHAQSGTAEVHLLATPKEVEVMAERLEKAGKPLPPPSPATLPLAQQTGALRPEDWAFLGLLSSVGALDLVEGPTPELVAELLDTDPGSFAVQARTVERNMQDVVTGLFAPPGSEPISEGGPS